MSCFYIISCIYIIRYS